MADKCPYIYPETHPLEGERCKKPQIIVGPDLSGADVPLKRCGQHHHYTLGGEPVPEPNTAAWREWKQSGGGVEAPVDLSGLSKTKLRAIAKERGLTATSKLDKDELLELLS